MHSQHNSRWTLKRLEAGKRRKQLTPPATIRFSVKSPPKMEVFNTAAPAECIMAATDSAGDLATWFTPEFLKIMVNQWGPKRMILRLEATPGAILHNEIVRQMAWSRAQTDSWEIIADTDGQGLSSTAALDRLLTSPYHQLNFRLGYLPPEKGGGGRDLLDKQRSFHVIQELVELRNARKLEEPKIIWTFETRVKDKSQLARANTVARQLCVDRFVHQITVQS